MKKLKKFDQFINESRMDDILDRISSHGIDSLNDEERQFLDDASKGKTPKESPKQDEVVNPFDEGEMENPFQGGSIMMGASEEDLRNMKEDKFKKALISEFNHKINMDYRSSYNRLSERILSIILKTKDLPAYQSLNRGQDRIYSEFIDDLENICRKEIIEFIQKTSAPDLKELLQSKGDLPIESEDIFDEGFQEKWGLNREDFEEILQTEL